MLICSVIGFSTLANLYTYSSLKSFDVFIIAMTIMPLGQMTCFFKLFLLGYDCAAPLQRVLWFGCSDSVTDELNQVPQISCPVAFSSPSNCFFFSFPFVYCFLWAKNFLLTMLYFNAISFCRIQMIERHHPRELLSVAYCFVYFSFREWVWLGQSTKENAT